MSTTSATTLPLAAGTWTLDKNHSGVHFKVRHIGLTNVRGRFNDFDASLTVGSTLEDTAVTASIVMSSVDTNQADRDAHLLGTDFFSAEAHPTAEYRSGAIRDIGGGEYEVDGELTINGIANPVTLALEFTGSEVFPGDGQLHAGFIATAEVNRADYGIDFNMPIGIDKVAVGKKIKVELEIQFIAPAA